MSSESSLATTAASDTSSSADSRYCSSRGGARGEATSKPARRRSYNLKARGVVIAKPASSSGGNQKVLCSCKACKGQRLVSKSTCYRHLRAEAEIAEDDVRPEAPGWNAYTQRETLRMYQFLHLAAGIRLGFVQWWYLSILPQITFDLFTLQRGHGLKQVTKPFLRLLQCRILQEVPRLSWSVPYLIHWLETHCFDFFVHLDRTERL